MVSGSTPARSAASAVASVEDRTIGHLDDRLIRSETVGLDVGGEFIERASSIWGRGRSKDGFRAVIGSVP
jgi:hypothetical protein